MNKKTAAEQWSGAADGCARWSAVRAALLSGLDLATIASGSRVLDVGCWSGDA
jgi:cyclopropane fatty-acyl-phospholipid synthase-like methyltransferase